jgi:ATP/ADP translocase
MDIYSGIDPGCSHQFQFRRLGKLAIGVIIFSVAWELAMHAFMAGVKVQFKQRVQRLIFENAKHPCHEK